MTEIRNNIVIAVGGELGGIGKSTVTCTIAQWLQDRQVPCIKYDADRTNPNFFRRFNKNGCEVKLCIFSEGTEFDDSANSVLNDALEQSVLLNLPAQSWLPMKRWYQANSLSDLALETGIQFHHIYLTDGSSESRKLLLSQLDFFEKDAAVRFVVARNWGKNETAWQGFDEDKPLHKRLKAKSAIVIDIPRFHGNQLELIDSRNMTFGEAREAEDFGLIGRQRVKSYLKKCYAEFEEKGVFCD